MYFRITLIILLFFPGITSCVSQAVEETNEISKSSYLGVLFSNHSSGVRIVNIYPGSPADKAGFHNGDIITHVDNRPVGGEYSLRRIIRVAKPGSSLMIRYITTQGEYTEKKVKVEALPDEPLQFPPTGIPAKDSNPNDLIPYK